MIAYAKGKDLDNIAKLLGLKRKKFWLFFKETDKKLRERVAYRVDQICQRKIGVLGCKLLEV